MELEKNPKTRKLYKRLLELEDKIGKRPFPEMRRVVQITSYHCGPAVLEALFSFLGVKVSQRGLTKSLRATNKIKKHGLSVNDLARACHAAHGNNYFFWRKMNATISDLDKAVNTYRSPVGVEWQGVFYEFEDEDNGHYGIVTAVDRKKGTLRIADPFPEFAGIDRRFNLSFFVRRWWDFNVVKGRKLKDIRMMFVITPKADKWPKELGMISHR